MPVETTLVDKQAVVNSNQLIWVIELNRLMRDTLRTEHELTVAHYRILALLDSESATWHTTSLARRLNLTPSMISISVKGLRKNGLVNIIPHKDNKPAGTIEITEQGASVLHEADLSIAAAQDEYFGVLNPELRSIIATGAAMTSQSRELAMRLHDGKPLNAYSILEGYLISEQCNIISSKKCGLPVTDTRILLYLFESRQRVGRNRDCTPTALMNGLLLSRATISERLSELCAQGLVVFADDNLDKRSFTVSLTTEGEQRCLEYIDTMYCEIAQDLRPSSDEERRRYSDAAATVVSHLRAHR